MNLHGTSRFVSHEWSRLKGKNCYKSENYANLNKVLHLCGFHCCELSGDDSGLNKPGKNPTEHLGV